MKKFLVLLTTILLVSSLSIVFARSVAKATLKTLDITVDAPEVGKALASTIVGKSNLSEKDVTINVVAVRPKETSKEFAMWDPSDETVKSATEYTIKIVVPMPETATVDSSFKATVNGNEANTSESNNALVISYKFPATSTGTITRPSTGSSPSRPSTGRRPSTSTSISKVEFTMPELENDGEQIKKESVTVTDGIEITAMSWTNVTGKAFMTANEKYREGSKYSVRIFFAPAEGKTVSDNPEVTVNGEKVEATKRDDGVFLLDKEFALEKPAAPEIKDYISKVEFTVPEVVAGNSRIEEKDMTIKGAKFAGFTWANEKTHATMVEAEKYEEGIKYTLRMFFKAEDGYGFKDLKVTVNGEEVEPIEVEAPTHYKFEKTFEVKKAEETKPEETKPEETKPEEIKPEETKSGETKPEEIKKPVLTNIDVEVAVPEVGKALPGTYKVKSNLVDEDFEYKIGEKKEDNLGEWTPADKEVKAGSKYTFKLAIELKNSMAEISKDLKLTINKKEVKATVKDGVYTISYDFETEKEEEKANSNELYNLFAFEITAPTIGNKPETKAKAKSENYKVKKVEWLTKDTKFVAGETYTVDIYFELVNKNVRSDYFATVNGIQAELPNGDANFEKNTMYAEFTFPTLLDTSSKATWSNASPWAIDELSKAANKGAIPNVLNKQDLTKNVTRKEFAHIAVKLYEIMTGKGIRVTSAPFKDTDDAEVAKAYTVGITTGTTETTFTPDKEIKREEMATMMYRALEKAGIDTSVDLTKVKEFTDDKDMHNWSRSAIYFMAEAGIINGVDSKQYRYGVASTATREQALVIAIRSIEGLGKSK